MKIKPENIPAVLKDREQWVLWKMVERGGKLTKVPFSVDGSPAKANDPTTWSPYLTTVRACDTKIHAGIGYEFSADDPFVGIDLDSCRDLETGEIADWAQEIIQSLNSYAEISPSQTGVKIFIRGELKAGGVKVTVDAPRLNEEKDPGIEIYDRGRYFAVTGWRIDGPADPMQRQEQLDALIAKHKPKPAVPVRGDFNSTGAVVERARKYLATMPPAVSGSRGHDVTFRTACVLVQGFLLDRGDALGLLAEWNQGCQPPWSERELDHKIDSAMKAQGERGYLRDVPQQRWASVRVPEYKAPPEKPQPRIITLDGAAARYLETIRSGQETLIETGLPDLDYAIGGGVEPGEMVILAARPSHGKSAVALQAIHHWTQSGIPTLLISEEMSELALGKRTLQFASDIPQEHWRTSMDNMERDLTAYSSERAKCYIAESCRTAAVAAEQIEKAVQEYGVRCVVVDYAGLLQSEGKSRYEQMTNTSVAMRQAASTNKVVLLLQCQLSREIEKRPTFMPLSSDLRDTGQLEQDADVIIFCCWPHRIDSKVPPNQYQFFITKNRNRAINSNHVTCKFDPSRQMFSHDRPDSYVYQESDDGDWDDGVTFK